MPKLCKIPSPKALLFKVYADLERIQKHIRSVDDKSDLTLTEFEKAVLALEDRRFFTHCGVDPQSVVREIIRALRSKRHGGASTIDMQFVRTCTGYQSPTMSRKLYEMLLAIILQWRASKLSILRGYLRVVYLGSGISGIQAAAWTVYGKSEEELTRSEACRLAAMMVYPRPLRPSPAWDKKVEKRALYAERVIPRLVHLS